MPGVEAIAVLGAISSVIAIIDKTKEVYDAASSATGLPTAFQEVSNRLPAVRAILRSAEQHIGGTQLDAASCSVITPIIKACEERAERLRAIFDKVIPGDEASRLARYITAAKTLGKGERVETLMKGLMDDVSLLASEHGMGLATAQQVDELKSAIKDLSAIEPSIPIAALEDTPFTNNNFGNGPMTNNNVMGSQNSQSNYGSGEQYQAGTQNFHMKNGRVDEQHFHASVQQYFSSHTAATEEQLQQRCEDGVLEQLEFHDMQERYYDIPEAHQKTFQWIYERPDLGFVQWLQAGSGIYWITGKAGSGKSTLMKFIYQDQRTRDYLPDDVGHSLISSFFFHDRGQNPLLKSQEGLFRAILHSILSNCRQLIPITLPNRYEKLKRAVRSGQQLSSFPVWSANELRTGFKALVSQSKVRLHFCLLIDGLDEFSGNHEDIIATLKDLFPTAADSQVRVQMCLSSRPLAVFEESYLRHTHLQVQDLTEDDIKFYVTTKFNEIPRATNLVAEDPATTNLIIREILTKAEGVFIWVTLVVRSLIEGLRNRDNMKTLKRRLSALPAGLTPLYKSMIGHIGPHYHEEAARTFHMVQLAAEPLSPLAMSFSDDEPQDALSPNRLLSDAEISKRHSDTARQLKARTAGLIEISPTVGDSRGDTSKEPGVFSTQRNGYKGPLEDLWAIPRLRYLHLTVKEFLLSSDVPSWLVEGTSTSAAAHTHLIIVACWLRQLQVTGSPRIRNHFRRGRFVTYAGTGDYVTSSDPVFAIMFHAREVERATRTSTLPYLEVLDKFFTKKKETLHWTWSQYHNENEPDEWRSDYVSYLVTIRMTHSVIDAFKSGYNPAAKPGRPLLLYAICCVLTTHLISGPDSYVPEPAIVEELLKRKCDPNKVLGSLSASVDRGARTVWEALMSHLARHSDSNWGHGYENRWQYVERLSTEALCNFRLKWLKTIELFLDHGANPTQLVIQYRQVKSEDGWSLRTVATHRLSVLSLYDQVFAYFDNPMVSAVRASMVEKGATEFRDNISEETARLYKKGVPDEWVRSPADDLSDYTHYTGGISTMPRSINLFKRALARWRTRKKKVQKKRK